MNTKPRRRERGLDPQEILERLRSGKRVRRSLPERGRLSIDRALPFLCVYRRPPDLEDPGTADLVTGIACYLTASGGRRERAQLTRLVSFLCDGLVSDFGAVLLVEIWARRDDAGGEAASKLVRIITRRDAGIAETTDELEASLAQVRVPVRGRMLVETVAARRVVPPRLSPLLADAPAPSARGVHRVGIEVPRIYLDAETGVLFPMIHRALRRGLASAINRAAYRFTRARTTHQPAHYHALGRRSFTKAVWAVDAKLAEVSNGFDFLLLTTPRNAEEAWAAFRRGGFERPPHFSYRPRPVDVALTKRELYSAPLERIEDPTVSEIFQEQRDEIDRKLTMIGDRGTPRFVQESLQLFGGVDDELLRCALEILGRIPPRAREVGRGAVDARSLAARAEEEIKLLRQQYEGVQAQVEIRSDVSGLLVSRGNLLVGAQTSVPVGRVEALLQHEVGTHVLTYFNGMAQPFRQLRVGLAGYEELQEGLAVLAEYLVGGLSRPRLRLLAARVLAVHRMLGGATFVEVFRELDRDWDLARRTAFSVAMRVFRGGGHTKDAVYLRGLLRLLEHLRTGNPLEPLYVGKIGLHHVTFVEELTFRKVLVPPPLRPRYLDRTDAQERLARLREGLAVHDLVASPRPARTRRIA